MAKSLKIKKASAADLVCSKMKEMVVDGTWAANAKLPSEADLAESFGVNRLTVRIALQRLNALGILDTRVGDGTYVKPFDFDKHLNEISEFYVTDQVMQATLEFRAIIEEAAGDLCMKRRTEKEMAAMRACCEAFEEEINRYYTLTDSLEKHESFIRTVDIGVAFHAELMKMSHNELLQLSFSLAKEPIRRHMTRNAAVRISEPDNSDSREWVKAYWDVYNAIEAKDKKAFKLGIKKLINLKS